jgi:hypothetical protein
MSLIDTFELQLIGDFIARNLKQQLMAQGQNASMNLLNSIEPKVIQSTFGTDLIILMAPYYQYVNNGRKGGKPDKSKKPPIGPLIQWVINKGLATGDREVLSAAYAIQNSIWKNGTLESYQGKSKRNFIENTFDRIGDQVLAMVSTKVFDDFEARIENLAKNATIKLTS